MRERKAVVSTSEARCCPAPLAIFLVAVAAMTAACSGQAASDTTRVRGELDRNEWTLRVCSTGEYVHVVFPSTVYSHYRSFEEQAGVAATDPVVAEFDVVPIASVSTGPRSVGVMRVIKIERGRCGDAA